MFYHGDCNYKIKCKNFTQQVTFHANNIKYIFDETPDNKR